MNNEKLEIVIPTWNRAKYLENTLIQFMNSPFFNYKITIIDNDSTDNTNEICKKYEQIFPNLIIVKNNKNIGLAGNILRCLEVATAEYMWIVGDNDNYDFSDCSEIFNEMEKSWPDIIFIQGKYGDVNISLRETTTHELTEKGYGNDFIILMGTLSGYIFKTEYITPECLQQGYNMAKYLYPQLVIANKALNENFKIYISSKRIRIAAPNPHVSYNTLELINGWVTSNSFFDKKYRKYGLENYLGDIFPLVIMGAIIRAKVYKIEDYKRTMNDLIISLFRTKGIIRGTLYAILMITTSLIPCKIAKYALNKKEKQN